MQQISGKLTIFLSDVACIQTSPYRDMELRRERAPAAAEGEGHSVSGPILILLL